VRNADRLVLRPTVTAYKRTADKLLRSGSRADRNGEGLITDAIVTIQTIGDSQSGNTFKFHNDNKYVCAPAHGGA
jgi:hypothetical protein